MKRSLTPVVLAVWCLMVLAVMGPGMAPPAHGVTAVGLQDDFIRVAEQLKPSVVSLKAVYKAEA